MSLPEADNTRIGSFKSTPNEYPLAPTSPSDEPVRVCPDTSRPSNRNREVVFGGKDEISSLNKVIIKDETRDATHASSRVGRGKNPCAMSVLRLVQMKLDGRDISENREISISKQVDYLPKQATSADNLCNMYEELRMELLTLGKALIASAIPSLLASHLLFI
ncbi:putative non-specific serine/threonine protein kinase [Rosa chinensis]|uniref:Putative non-specific serine/threonine protein kinase n=1 Tax=Rosa chinensis TaxID=74649 RepID=A0A2P6PN06_ROSCH|nr:putative non-specific serine/threonine protein kinase [Rosa chinensis]